jgi:hypothetical protein
MRNFSKPELEAIVMIFISWLLVIASFSLLLEAPSVFYRFVCIFAISFNVVVILYWLKKLIKDDSW